MLQILHKLACWVLLPLLLAGPALAADVGSMQPSEIVALQHRLTDAKCYAWPVDGQTSEALTKAIAACPPQEPQLRIETGMHVAPIRRIGVDRACRITGWAVARRDAWRKQWRTDDRRGDLDGGNRRQGIRRR